MEVYKVRMLFPLMEVPNMEGYRFWHSLSYGGISYPSSFRTNNKRAFLYGVPFLLAC